MTRYVRSLLVVGLLAGMGCNSGKAASSADSIPGATRTALNTVRDDTLRAELLRREKADQGVRQELIAALQTDGKPDSAIVMQMHHVDSSNTAWMKSVVAKHGWPGRSLVGVDGASAAFLFVQHADQDTAFQASMLPLVERAYANKEVPGNAVALLTDRVAKARNQPQVYGSQANIIDGRVELAAIADSAHVDERRARMGLMPLADYVRVLDSVYTSQGKP